MKRRLSRVLAVLAVLMVLVGCRKDPAKGTHEQKVATVPEKIQPLFKTWKLDVNASSEMNAKTLEKATGIRADVKFDKDVGKAAQFAARTLFFTFEKGKLTRAYEERYGEGLLSTSSSGWFTADDDAKSLTLKDAAQKETAYTIEELATDKLVLAPRGGGSFEVYRTPGSQFTPASTVTAVAAADRSATAPVEVQPNEKNKKDAYKAGEKVAGRWSRSVWWMATVKGKNGDRYDVAWADGTTGRVAASDMVPVVPARSLKVGDRVAGCWRSCRSSLYMGAIEKINPKRPAAPFTIKWDDGTSSDVKEGEVTRF